MKKYEVLESYCHYWVLRILISRIGIRAEGVGQEVEDVGGLDLKV